MMHNNRLFLTGLNTNANARDIMRGAMYLFAKFGKIKTVKVNPDTLSKGFACVIFENEQQANVAKKQYDEGEQCIIDGWQLEVKSKDDFEVPPPGPPVSDACASNGPINGMGMPGHGMQMMRPQQMKGLPLQGKGQPQMPPGVFSGKGLPGGGKGGVMQGGKGLPMQQTPNPPGFQQPGFNPALPVQNAPQAPMKGKGCSMQQPPVQWNPMAGPVDQPFDQFTPNEIFEQQPPMQPPQYDQFGQQNMSFDQQQTFQPQFSAMPDLELPDAQQTGVWEECHQKQDFAALGWVMDPTSGTWYDEETELYYEPGNMTFINREGEYYNLDSNSMCLLQIDSNGTPMPEGKSRNLPTALQNILNVQQAARKRPFDGVMDGPDRKRQQTVQSQPMQMAGSQPSIPPQQMVVQGHYADPGQQYQIR